MRDIDLLGVVTGSRVRREILLLLGNGPMVLADIKSHVDISSQQLSPCIRELIAHDLIRMDARQFRLTCAGQAIVARLKPFLRAIDLIELQGDFWKGRQLIGIPDHLIRRLDEIGPGMVITDDPSDLDRTNNEIYRLLESSQHIRAATSIYLSNIILAFTEQAIKKKSISIIMKSRVYDKLIVDCPRAIDIYNLYHGVDFYLSDTDLPCFIVTEKYLFISPHFYDGNIDLYKNFVSTEDSAIRWGHELFEFYLSDATLIVSGRTDAPSRPAEGRQEKRADAEALEAAGRHEARQRVTGDQQRPERKAQAQGQD